MPPRILFAAIALAWLLVTAWFVADRWLPWWRPGDKAPFAIELADEVAPEHASWLVTRKGIKAGTSDTRMAPKKDGVFEFSSRLRDIDIQLGTFSAKVPGLQTLRMVDREGALSSLQAQATVQVKGLNVDRKVKCQIKAVVENRVLTTTIEAEGGKPITTSTPMSVRSCFVSLQPWNKYPQLVAGQTWKEIHLDPLSVILELAGQVLLQQELGLSVPRFDRPQELLAQVLPERERIEHRGESIDCWVIVHRAKDEVARTWVDHQTGRVIRHLAEVAGERTVMHRE